MERTHALQALVIGLDSLLVNAYLQILALESKPTDGSEEKKTEG